MLKKLFSYVEPNKKIRTCAIVLICLLLLGSAASFFVGVREVNGDYGKLEYLSQVEMKRDRSKEDYSEDSSVCDVTYRYKDVYMVIPYTYKDYKKLDSNSTTGYTYKTETGVTLAFNHKDPTKHEIRNNYHMIKANETMSIFNMGIALIILACAVLIMTLFAQTFTTYEKSWFLSIMVLATIVAVLFPEESANGVNGIIIMLLYLLDTFLNILCELLISKQSRYNFLVSIGVEITEILICIVLMYRFATMVSTLFFWLPIDIASYINWSKHKDDEEDELTAVRRLKGWQEVLVIASIVLWTIVVGYFISGLDIRTDFFNNNRTLETLIIYIDACASAVGIANGLFIFFRFREQWIAWYISAALESIMNILSGQFVLLVLKLGYFTNTTYGYIKWSRYIKEHDKATKKSIF